MIDMLCVSGFSRDDEWGYRDIEPKKTSIVSIALVMLKTTGSGNRMATAQKLLLFWRKPAERVMGGHCFGQGGPRPRHIGTGVLSA
ncbi:unnamed protein product [Mortierella alpina]